jgi:hypothetical protein
MSLYYRINDGALVDITESFFLSLAANKRDLLRPYVVDPEPAPSSTEWVAPGPVVVTATEARKTWILVPKTEAEIAFDAYVADRNSDLTLIRQVYIALKNGTGTAAERLVRVERVCARFIKDIFRGEPS